MMYLFLKNKLKMYKMKTKPMKNKLQIYNYLLVLNKMVDKLLDYMQDK